MLLVNLSPLTARQSMKRLASHATVPALPAPRLKDMAAAKASALKGKGVMPAKGGNSALPDADVIAAVEYIASQSK